MIFNELFMQRTLKLAALGLGKAQPNPLVGAVIVHNDTIIGEGFHQQYGTPHAEVNAIHAVKNQELLKNSTLYVNLEPCAHFGKTPPCTSLIIEKKIPKVVVGINDPNPKVNGLGIKTLREAGIEVIENVLFDQSLQLNKRFITYHTKKRPYIFLKWAQTKNGFMDIVGERRPYWITNHALRVWSHKLRNEEQSILIGYNTLINDNPQLTNRLFGTNQPEKFVLTDTRSTEINEKYCFLKGDINDALATLYRQNIQSVIVEGGKKTLQKFIDMNVWDEIFVLTGNVTWNTGILSPNLPHIPNNKITIDGETITHCIRKIYNPYLICSQNIEFTSFANNIQF